MQRLNMAKKSEGARITFARAHGTIKVPNAPQIGPELSETGIVGSKKLKMTAINDPDLGHVVVIEVGMPGRVLESIAVPLSNFSHLQKAKDEENSTS